MRVIHGQQVHGCVIDDRTRCSHYNSELDVIAIRFKCCDRWFPCRECHDEDERHDALIWPRAEFSYKAILCGMCGAQLSIDDYLSCANECPACAGRFNPGCASHYHLYFDTGNSA
jgi:uncharacterized CHY-type Zn-finger protein